MTVSLNVLLLCDYHLPGSNANALADHINSFQKYSKHNIFVLSSVGDLPADFDIDVFDVLVIHYSIVVIGTSYLSEWAKERIANFKGLKVQYIQDEYREINRFQIEIDRLGIDLLFTCIPSHLWKYTYPDYILPRVTLRPTLTGYVPGHLLTLPAKPIAERGIDVFYRGRQVPYWIGSATMEKYEIAQEFSRRAHDSGLVLDLASSEHERLYGEEWLRRLGNARCTLGVESAASLLDFTGGFQRRTEAFVQAHPAASFAEVEAACFPGMDNRFSTAQISPRCFEAAAMRTCMVLFEGGYSGILEPGRHYIALKKDFSNFDTVCNSIRDHSYLQAITDRAYSEVAQNRKYAYSEFVKEFESSVSEVMAQKGIKPQGRRSIDITKLFRTAHTYYRPEVGRLHGPLYFANHGENLLFVSREFSEYCYHDIQLKVSVVSTRSVAEPVATLTSAVTVGGVVRTDPSCSIGHKVMGGSGSSEPVVLLTRQRSFFRRVLLFCWRLIPYRLRLLIEPVLLAIKR